MERLKRLREPAVVLALAGSALHLVLGVVWAVGSPDPLGSTLASPAILVAESTLLLLLTALLLACRLVDPTPHARGLTVAGLVVTGALLIGVAALVVASTALAPEADGWDPSFLPSMVAALTVASISLAIQIILLREPVSQPVLAVPAELEPAEPEPEPVDPQQQPEWTPDAAVGTVWRRAGDATSQRPATSWDASGVGGGWEEPDPGAETPTEPTRRAED